VTTTGILGDKYQNVEGFRQSTATHRQQQGPYRGRTQSKLCAAVAEIPSEVEQAREDIGQRCISINTVAALNIVITIVQDILLVSTIFEVLEGPIGE
jgi:hypothetical protein